MLGDEEWRLGLWHAYQQHLADSARLSRPSAAFDEWAVERTWDEFETLDVTRMRTRMRTLNGAQHAKGRQLHLCPLQFDIADRVIAQMSMPGEVVYDPFSGLGTVPLRALKLGRRGLGVELNAGYHADAVHWLEPEPELDLESVTA